MSDVSKTNEELRKALNVAREHFSAIAASGEIKVWEDTGEKRGIDYQAKVWAERGARLASEALAATRVPAQGEPNGDREALARKLREGDDPVNTWEQASESQRHYWLGVAGQKLAESTSRASVPDAATERERRIESHDHIEDGSSYLDCAKCVIDVARADRDAAVAAIERVRAIHARLDTQSQYPMLPDMKPMKLQVCSHCKRPGAGDALHPWPCPSIRALDGAPEPEWEREYRRVRPDGVPVFNAVFESLPVLDDYYTAEYRTVSQWLPVEGESKS